MLATSETTAEEMTLQIYAGPSLERGVVRWREFQSAIGTQSWSCHAAWVENFVKHYSDVSRIECVFVSSYGETIGAGLVCQKRLSVLGSLGFQAVLNGTGGEPDGDPFYCEHHRLLARDENYPAVEKAVSTYALSKPGVDAVYWSGYDEAQVDSLLTRDNRCEVSKRPRRVFDLYDDLVSPNTAFADWIDSPEAASAATQQLIEWNRSQWGHVGQNGYEGRYERFLADVIPALVADGEAFIVRTTDACVVLFRQDGQPNRLLAYVDAAVDTDSLLACHDAAMALAAERGFRQYELAVVHAPGLENLGGREEDLLWIRIGKRTWRSGLVFGVSRIKQRLRR